MNRERSSFLAQILFMEYDVLIPNKMIQTMTILWVVIGNDLFRVTSKGKVGSDVIDLSYKVTKYSDTSQ